MLKMKNLILILLLKLLVTQYLFAQILFKEGASNLGVITSSGSLGLGTTNPQARLDVVGTMRVQNLLGGAKRMVIADANGELSAMAIPQNTDDQTLYLRSDVNLGYMLGITDGNEVSLGMPSAPALLFYPLRKFLYQSETRDTTPFNFSVNVGDILGALLPADASHILLRVIADGDATGAANPNFQLYVMTAPDVAISLEKMIAYVDYGYPADGVHNLRTPEKDTSCSKIIALGDSKTLNFSFRKSGSGNAACKYFAMVYIDGYYKQLN